MMKLRVLACLLAVGLLAGGWLVAQNKKADEPKQEQPKAEKPEDTKEVTVTHEQKLSKIKADYRLKTDALKQKLKQLSDEESAEIDKVLLDTQKAKLKEIKEAAPQQQPALKKTIFSTLSVGQEVRLVRPSQSDPYEIYTDGPSNHTIVEIGDDYLVLKSGVRIQEIEKRIPLHAIRTVIDEKAPAKPPALKGGER